MSQPPPLPPQPPQQPLNYYTPGPAPIPGGVPCPRCRQNAAKRVSFTWWGGVLGPKMLNHHKCQACGYTFNGRTGQPNDTAIAIYIAVSFVIMILIFILLFAGGVFR